MHESRLKDHRRPSVVRPSLELDARPRRLKKLDAGQAAAHLTQLGSSLEALARLVRTQSALGGANAGFCTFVDRLAHTAEAMRRKRQLEALKPNHDVALDCAIDPGDSGFPVFVRDYRFLVADHERASDALSKLPSDVTLVEQALDAALAGRFPAPIITRKLERDYFLLLATLELPAPLRVAPIELDSGADGVTIGRLSVERLDPHFNLPRYYTLYMVLDTDRRDPTVLSGQLTLAIEAGLGTVVDAELRTIAEHVSRVDGVRLEMIERFDVGPFYNRFTDNGGGFAELFRERPEQDFVMGLRHTIVQRTGGTAAVESASGGARSVWRRLVRRSGDGAPVATFSPAIASPRHLLMPHRLIQLAHAGDVELGEGVVMHGVTDGGELVA